MQRSRRDLLEWIRSLGMKISTIEELGKGAVICEILATIHGEFPSNFIRNPTGEQEYLRNMKICQDFFHSKGIRVHFPVERLVKCRMQDNLEFAQWLARYYQKHVGMMSEKNRACATATTGDVKRMKERRCIEEEEKKCVDKTAKFEENVSKMQFQLDEMKQRESGLVEEVGRLRRLNGVLCNGNFKEILMIFEKERNFYFNKLLIIEKYFIENENVDRDIREDMFEILYESGFE